VKDLSIETSQQAEYDVIKVINYIRRCQMSASCFACKQTFIDTELLTKHIHEAGCISQEPAQGWRDAQYLFPTFDNDALLTLDFGTDDEEEEQENPEGAMLQSELLAALEINDNDESGHCIKEESEVRAGKEASLISRTIDIANVEAAMLKEMLGFTKKREE
jgi:hypothetical protein